jgi:hypothetical protein
MPEAEIKRLALDAIKCCLSLDLADHEQNGWSDYLMNDECVELVRRAKRFGLVVEPPYPGYPYLRQAD